jgi:hypothetical protein
MRRLLLFPLLLALAGGCATYKNDLDRAKAHYQANEFEAALALLRILEIDMDSLGWADRAEYAYTRGMTDYRLAELAKKTEGVNDPRKAFRAHSRHWLGVAAAIEKNHPQSLTGEAKTRLEQTMVDLNREVYGGGEAPAPPGGDGAKACKSDSDCDKFQLCEGNTCVTPAKKVDKKNEL